MMQNIEHRRKRLKDIVKNKIKKKRVRNWKAALKVASKNFVVPVLSKGDINGCFDQVKPHVKVF